MALKTGDKDQKKILQFLLRGKNSLDNTEKINNVKSIFEATSARTATQDLIQHHSDLADIELQKLSINEDQKNNFRGIKDWLIKRIN